MSVHVIVGKVVSRRDQGCVTDVLGATGVKVIKYFPNRKKIITPPIF